MDTLLVVMYINNTFPEDKELWELVIRKAKKWVTEKIEDEKVRKEIWQWVEAWTGNRR